MGFYRAWLLCAGPRRCHTALENNYNHNDDASKVGLPTILLEQMCVSPSSQGSLPLIATLLH